jgi:hypothetical protein
MMGLAICIAGFAMSAAAQNTFPASGNVGIGTTAPANLLDVSGNADVQGIFSVGTPIPNTNARATFNGENAYGTLFFTNTGQTTAAGLGMGIEAHTNELIVGDSVGDFAIWGYGTPKIDFSANSGASDQMVLLNNGNVGIGTTIPGAKLEVNGTAQIDGNLRLNGTNGGIVFPDGSTQLTAFNPTICGGDYAESVDVTGARASYEPGDVLVLDMENPGKVLKSIEAYSTSVSGIYSTKPGTVGRRQTTAKSPDEVPMAMMGIVPTKVSTENGPVKVGDLLVSSSKAGYAMKGTDRDRMLGAVIGKAMGKLDSGMGVIEVLVTLQ